MLCIECFGVVTFTAVSQLPSPCIVLIQLSMDVLFEYNTKDLAMVSAVGLNLKMNHVWIQSLVDICLVHHPGNTSLME